MIALIVDFVASAGEGDALRQLLQTQAANSLKNEGGCRHFDVCADPDNADHFMLYELYDDEAAVEAHRATDYYGAFRENIDPLLKSRELRTLTRL